ncbi:hypothetical protein DFJ74DRAFT_713040 [Hyaloraphidium curvatum]|nr:hypothetical protein DFJ74DRAFT_713040 [Hyaloraphidium curvatum]
MSEGTCFACLLEAAAGVPRSPSDSSAASGPASSSSSSSSAFRKAVRFHPLVEVYFTYSPEEYSGRGGGRPRPGSPPVPDPAPDGAEMLLGRAKPSRRHRSASHPPRTATTPDARTSDLVAIGACREAGPAAWESGESH